MTNWFLAGYVTAIVLCCAFIFSSGMVSYYKQARTLIPACEAELPRNQNCVLTAIPEPPKEGADRDCIDRGRFKGIDNSPFVEGHQYGK